jgi:hypothetical protein
MMRKIFFLFYTLFTSVLGFPQFLDFETTDFTKPDSIAALYENFDLKDQQKLTSLLTKDLSSDVEKFRAIFKWIANNISYDIVLYDEKKKKEYQFKYKKRKLEKWKKGFDKRLLKRLIIGKESICSGYSSLLETMCGFAGITCEVISGYGRNELDRMGYGVIDHAWNAVFINNKWYLSDPTWAAGYVNEDFNQFRKRFNKNYFLADPFFFALDHYPKNPDWLLLTDKPTLKYFLNSPYKGEGFITNKLNHYKPTEGSIKLKGDSVITFAFTSNLPPDSLKKVSVDLYSKSKFSFKHFRSEVFPLKVDQEGYYNFNLILKEKGLIRIRIFIGRKLAFTYEVFSR